MPASYVWLARADLRQSEHDDEFAVLFGDTGSEQVLLGLELARQVTKARTNEWDILRGTSGRVQDVYKADAVKLAFGKLLLQADDVVAFDLTRFSDDAGTEISGFLGFSLLF